MQARANLNLDPPNDLHRTQVIMLRVHLRLMELGQLSEAAEQGKLNGEADQLAGDRSASKGETRNDGTSLLAP